VAVFTGESSLTVEGWIGVNAGMGVGFGAGAVVAVGARVISFSGHHVTAGVANTVENGMTKRRASIRAEYEDA
jgi:hypothetical protein